MKPTLVYGSDTSELDQEVLHRIQVLARLENKSELEVIRHALLYGLAQWEARIYQEEEEG